MNIRDHTAKRRPPRIRWLLTIAVSFTAGFVGAATLFAYSSRIPIPLKITPTRGADDILRSEPKSLEQEIEFQDRLKSRVIGTTAPPEPSRQPRQPNLPEPTTTTTSKPEPVPVTPSELAYFVQAGAFSETGTAEQLAAELNEIGLVTSIREESSASGSKLFRVLVGPFTKAGEAEQARAELALSGRTTSLLRLSPDQGN